MSTLIVLVIGIALAWFFTKRVEDNLEKRVQAIESQKKLHLLALEIEQMWSSGQYPNVKELICSEFKGEKLDEKYRRFRQCNPDLLNCWIESNAQELGALIGEKKPGFKSVKYGKRNIKVRFGPRARLIALKIEDLKNHQYLDFELRDSCRDSYLPEGQYALGVLERSKEDWFWDNIHRDIYIDKFPVNNREIREWLEYANFDENQKKIIEDLEVQESLSWLMSAATNLNQSQQELFCAFQGRSLLTAELFDAAAFFPSNTEFLKHRPRGPYPEGLRRQDSYLGMTQAKGEKVELEKLCSSYFVKGCEEFVGPLYAHSEFGTSWAGVFQVLGGHFENLRNLVNPRKNLKLSSQYYPWSSSWHQIAERGHWSGEGDSNRHFNWRTEDPAESKEAYQVAFRCSTQRYKGQHE